MPYSPPANLPRCGVVDLGSNSVRLVVYEGDCRNPMAIFNEKAVLRFTDDVVRNVKASDKNLKAVQAFLSPGAVVELTLTIGYYMMVCRFLETAGVEGEEGQAEWLKTAKL
jgi:exopolyphosphatase/guanosine-5'-triphosphate,3'-diphosphate pyrophosphatase